MPHRYIDTSDLNAPYDQYRSAHPLQGLGAAKHLYMDYSDLNAMYDRQRPAIHGLGGGSLGGNALGTGYGSGVEQPVGLVSDEAGCMQLTSAHGRMNRGGAAMPGDVELMAQFERNVDKWGCPEKRGNHWFWTGANTIYWTRRGYTDEMAVNDWDADEGWMHTLYVPPALRDMGEISIRGGATEVVAETAPAFDVTRVQSAANSELSKMGCAPLTVDGDLGPQTCGALVKVYQEGMKWTDEMGAALDSCSAFNYRCKVDSPPITKPPVDLPDRRPRRSLSTNTVVIGGAVVAAVLLIGGAYYYRSM